MLKQPPEFQFRHGLSTAASSAHDVGIVVVKSSLKRLKMSNQLLQRGPGLPLHGTRLYSPDEVLTREELHCSNTAANGGRGGRGRRGGSGK